MNNQLLAFTLVVALTSPSAGVIAADGGDRPVIDLIVAGDSLVTMDEARPLIEDGAVAIDDGSIVAIGSGGEIAAKYNARETLAGNDRVVMPGLINGHTHAAMTLLRGIADDHDLMDWLTNYIFPAEVRFVDAEFVRIGTELACWEMIRGGTTTFVDMYYFADSVAKAVDACGLRAIVASSVIDQKSPDAENGEQSLRHTVDFIKRWKGRNGRIIPAFAPHAVYTLSPERLVEVREQASKLQVPVCIHISETRNEMDIARELFQKTPVAHLEDLAFFDGPTIGAHVVWADQSEIPLLAKRGVGVIHNPTSNMKISSGVAPIADMLEGGVMVGLGTDGAASNNDLDMWEEMRLAAFLQKVATMDPRVLPAPAVLHMATLGGARAIGLGDQIGALTAGRRADLIQVSFADLHLVPVYDVVSHLVYVANAQDVVSVVVDGKVLMRDREILTVDAERVRREASALAARIRAAVVDKKR